MQYSEADGHAEAASKPLQQVVGIPEAGAESHHVVLHFDEADRRPDGCQLRSGPGARRAVGVVHRCSDRGHELEARTERLDRLCGNPTANPPTCEPWIAHDAIEDHEVAPDAAELRDGRCRISGVEVQDSCTDGREVAAGFLFNTIPVPAGTTKVGAPLMEHGVVIEAKLPAGHGLDTAAKTDMAGRIITR